MNSYIAKIRELLDKMEDEERRMRDMAIGEVGYVHYWLINDQESVYPSPTGSARMRIKKVARSTYEIGPIDLSKFKVTIERIQ